MPAKLKIESIEISKLFEDPANVRKHSNRNIAAIQASLQRFGQRKPIVVGPKNVVVAGSGTLRAANLLGWKRIDAVRTNLKGAEATAFSIADNRTAELAAWEDPELALTLKSLSIDEQIDELTTGFSPAEIAKLCGDQSEASELDLTPDVAKAPVSDSGDVWLCGGHRLYCGDALEEGSLSILMRGKADAVVTDPPYAIYGSSTGLCPDISDDKMVRPFFEQVFRSAMTVLPWFAHLYICCDWRSWASIWEAAKRAELSPKNCIVWDKGSCGLGSNYGMSHEFVGYFAKLPPRGAMSSTVKSGQRPVLRPNIFKANRVSGKEREHNAAKPVALFSELITNATDTGGIVLDMFLGSGTTLVTCEKLGRLCNGIEIEPKYLDVSIRRWQNHTGKAATLEDDGRTFAAVETSRKRKTARKKNRAARRRTTR